MSPKGTAASGAALTASDSKLGLLRRDKVRKEDVYRGDIAEETHLTPERYLSYILRKNVDRAQLNTFFLVYRRFITPEKLLQRLHKEFIDGKDSKFMRERLADIAAVWARDFYPEDFSNSPEMVARLFDLRNDLIGVRICFFLRDTVATCLTARPLAERLQGPGGSHPRHRVALPQVRLDAAPCLAI